MPELAEVEFYRKRWHQAAVGSVVRQVRTHADKKIFRDAPAADVIRALTGARLVSSEAQAKQMVFRFDNGAWLGVHLGMSGELTAMAPGASAGPHDHLVLDFDTTSLVFTDPRMFGGVRLHTGDGAPDWWTRIAPPLLSGDFTHDALVAFLRRRGRAPIKAVLLMQERFPGIGNWMADEILWRAAIHPAQPAGSLTPTEYQSLFREIRNVCRLALKQIAGSGEHLPHDLNEGIPNTWLFNHRWADGGRCPRTRTTLERAEIGGRTTCWSPARQVLRKAS